MINVKYSPWIEMLFILTHKKLYLEMLWLMFLTSCLSYRLYLSISIVCDSDCYSFPLMKNLMSQNYLRLPFIFVLFSWFSMTQGFTAFLTNGSTMCSQLFLFCWQTTKDLFILLELWIKWNRKIDWTEIYLVAVLF